MHACMQVVGGEKQLAVSKHLVGNHDEVTDLRFIGPREKPSHVAVATNSEQVRGGMALQGQGGGGQGTGRMLEG